MWVGYTNYVRLALALSPKVAGETLTQASFVVAKTATRAITALGVPLAC